jgi:hypothetical protein
VAVGRAIVNENEQLSPVDRRSETFAAKSREAEIGCAIASGGVAKNGRDAVKEPETSKGMVARKTEDAINKSETPKGMESKRRSVQMGSLEQYLAVPLVQG